MKLRNWLSLILCTALLIFSASTAGAASTTTTTYFLDETFEVECPGFSKTYNFSGFFTANDDTGNVSGSDSLPFDLTYYDGNQIFKISSDFSFATYFNIPSWVVNTIESAFPFSFPTIEASATVASLNFTETAWCCELSNSLTVNAVPVPAAVWLFGSGLLGLVGFRRKMKK